MDTTSAIVFVIDDDASVRRSLVRLVRSAGWEAEAFDSAQSFLEREPFDGVACIVLDLCMPKMSGQELQDRLRERHSLMPIVFLSGQSDIPTSVAAMKKGAVDFLLKPVDSDSLLRVIGEAMERHAQCLRQAHDMANIGGRLVRLSAREREVLEQVLTGRLNKQIASELGIAEKTVKVHRGRLMAKMEVRSVAELVHQCDVVGVSAPERCRL
ncbi:response regulator transcription factor [Agrilutibacter solisilvae]|uniref:Response regulator transcription factor n=1 Tax=Agrilutibacter solisilvae TaxID=2763317 RepID=A0A974XZS6_9GAMM|nr:response regulator [Lysobacter solisilvae]QSX78791.1 response regulator transcription factor [Lysobacter solisilvae]